MKSISKHESSTVSASLKRNGASSKRATADANTRIKVLDCLNQHEYQTVLGLLNVEHRDDETKNLRGVCLLRLHEFEKAIAVFRGLVLEPAGVWSRSDLPGFIKVNFALALFYGGHPSGAMDVLTEVHVNHEPSALALMEHVQQWKSEMNWWQRALWTAFNVTPSLKPVLPTEDLGTFAWDGQVLAV